MLNVNSTIISLLLSSVDTAITKTNATDSQFGKTLSNTFTINKVIAGIDRFLSLNISKRYEDSVLQYMQLLTANCGLFNLEINQSSLTEGVFPSVLFMGAFTKFGGDAAGLAATVARHLSCVKDVLELCSKLTIFRANPLPGYQYHVSDVLEIGPSSMPGFHAIVKIYQDAVKAYSSSICNQLNSKKAKLLQSYGMDVQ